MKQAIHFLLMAITGLIAWTNAEAKGAFKNSEADIANKTITRNYDVYGFDAIKSDVVGTIYFTQSTNNKSSLKIVGPEEFITQIKVEVIKGVLTINQKGKRQNNSNNSKLVIEISAPTLKSASIEGVGGFISEDGLNTDILNLNSDGVGNIKIKDLKCNKINISTNGIGNVTVSGMAKNATLEVNGVGSIKADALITDNVTANTNGVGSINCYAVKSITATTNGVGGITYKGTPSDKNIIRNGIGGIKNK